MADPSKTIFLVDDDHSVRRAVGRLLRSVGYEVETFAAARDFLEADTSLSGISCIVLDLQIPELSGLDLQEELRSRNIRLPIVFISGHGDIPSSVRAMKAGAVDFLPKPFQDSDLLSAVEQALERHEQEQSQYVELAALRRQYDTLTPREQEVMSLVAQGLLNKQIAARLGTVEKTIKVHRGRVMAKMRVKSLADLVRAAERLLHFHSDT
jgi:FixJ family two-component response regulator